MEAGLQVTVLGRFSRIYRLVASVSDLSCSGGTAPVSYQCYALHTRYCWPDLDNFKFEASSQDEGNDSTKGTASAPMQNPLLKLRLRVLCDFNRLQAPQRSAFPTEPDAHTDLERLRACGFCTSENAARSCARTQYQ